MKVPEVGDYVLVQDIDEKDKVDDLARYATGWVDPMHSFIGKVAKVVEVQSANYCKTHYKSDGGHNTVRLKMSNFSGKLNGIKIAGTWWFCVYHLELLPNFEDINDEPTEG